MEENAQLIVDKQNRSAYKFSLLSSNLFYLIWENIILSRSFFPGNSTLLGNCVARYFWSFTAIFVFGILL